jgi:hypothetical protein
LFVATLSIIETVSSNAKEGAKLALFKQEILKVTKKNQHVVPHQNGWAVKGAGNQRSTTVHSTQAEAIQSARSVAMNQQSELLIHGKNGQIRERNSYGNDPFPPKG